MLKTTFVLLGILSAVSLTLGRWDKHVKNATCYGCHTLTHAEICQTRNETHQHDMPTVTCSPAEHYCQVRRFSFSANGTEVKIWMMERRCALSCANECVITGDRSKLHLCTSCCKGDLCNVGNVANSKRSFDHPLSFLFVCFVLLYHFNDSIR